MKFSIRRSVTTTAAALSIAATLTSCGGGGGGGGGIGFGGPVATAPNTTAQLPERDALIARARALELNTPYVPPPGNVTSLCCDGAFRLALAAPSIAPPMPRPIDTSIITTIMPTTQ